MVSGRIKKIVPDRGFGFVRGENGTEVFFHRTETSESFDDLQEGDEVTYDVAESAKGPRARNLRKVGAGGAVGGNEEGESASE